MTNSDFKQNNPGAKVWSLPVFNQDDSVEEDNEALALPTAEEIAAIRESAFQEGKAEGYQKGMQQAQKQLTNWGKEFNRLMAQFTLPLEDQQEEVTKELAQLSIMVTKQLIRREVQKNPEQIIAVVREAIKLLPTIKTQIIIQLHPEDAKLIRKIFSMEDDAGTAENTTNWMITDDPSIARGGCLVSTDNSKIDATLEKRITDIFNHIFGDLRAPASEDSHG